MARFLIPPGLDSDFTPTLRLPVSEIDGINVHNNIKCGQLSTHHREHCFNPFITGTYVVEGGGGVVRAQITTHCLFHSI